MTLCHSGSNLQGIKGVQPTTIVAGYAPAKT